VGLSSRGFGPMSQDPICYYRNDAVALNQVRPLCSAAACAVCVIALN